MNWVTLPICFWTWGGAKPIGTAPPPGACRQQVKASVSSSIIEAATRQGVGGKIRVSFFLVDLRMRQPYKRQLLDHKPVRILTFNAASDKYVIGLLNPNDEGLRKLCQSCSAELTVIYLPVQTNPWTGGHVAQQAHYNLLKDHILTFTCSREAFKLIEVDSGCI